MTEALPLLVDDHVGVVHQVQEVPTEPGSPNFFHYAAKACNTSAFAGQVNFSNTGGASTHRPVAVAKAVGEAVERYCAALYQAQDLPLCSYREADFACVHPGDFALHSADQYDSPGFPWVPFTEETPIRWTPARDLGSGETLHVPAARRAYVFAASADPDPERAVQKALEELAHTRRHPTRAIRLSTCRPSVPPWDCRWKKPYSPVRRRGA